jgi:hypothetical protein
MVLVMVVVVGSWGELEVVMVVVDVLWNRLVVYYGA